MNGKTDQTQEDFAEELRRMFPALGAEDIKKLEAQLTAIFSFLLDDYLESKEAELTNGGDVIA
jgi:hypothetical protein